MNDQRQALRKAAIFISTLDSRSADALLDQMGEERAAMVRAAVLDLDHIDPTEQDQIVSEFVQTCEGGPAQASGAEEVELSLSAGAAAMADLPSATTPLSSERPFQFLHEATGGMIANFLKKEHPQTMASVMSHLPPRRAAEVLSRLEPDIQAEVLRRIADLDQADPEVVSEVEKEIESLLAHQIQSHQRRSAGMAAVSAILKEASGRQTALYDNLAEHQHELAEALQSYDAGRLDMDSTSPLNDMSRIDADNPVESPVAQVSSPAPDPVPAEIPITFEQFMSLSDGALATVFAHADPQITLLALAGAPEAFANRIAAQLPRRDRRSFAMRIKNIGPMRLRDVEEAQRYLSTLAGRLANKGLIRGAKSRRVAAIA